MCCSPNWKHSPHSPSDWNVARISVRKINDFHQYKHSFGVFQAASLKQQTNSLFFYILIWWELKCFDISISINCAGNLQQRGVWRQKNRITDMAVWNHKEIVHTRDLKQAFSEQSQRTWVNEWRNPQGGALLSEWALMNTPSLSRWSCLMAG